MSNHDTTITTLISAPTSVDASDIGDDGGSDNNSSRLIGGLVGSIGGAVVIGSLVLLFWFLRRRKRNNVKNHNPDLNPDVDGNNSDQVMHDKYGFKKLFGSKATTSGGNDITGFEHVTPYDHDGDDDFEYRGVTNNNLDSIFRSSQTNSGGGTTYYGSTHGDNTRQNSARHTRYSSMAYPNQVNEEDELFDFGMSPSSPNRDGEPSGANVYPAEAPVFESDSDGEDNLNVNRRDIFGDGNTSNNSRSRFTEEIV